MSHIVVSNYKRHLKLVSSEHLTGLKNSRISFLIVGLDVFIYLFDVFVRHPRISINDSQNNIFLFYLCRLEVILLQMLNTPTDIGSLASLLVLLQLVNSEANMFEFDSVFIDQF
jgi:hypothetical protein